MNLLAQSAFLKALGWSLLHSLWQMGVLWIFYLVLTADGKKFQSRSRYNMALVLVLTGSLAFLVTLVRQFYLANEPTIVYQLFNDNNSFPVTGGSLLTKAALALEPAMPLLSIAYLLAIALLFIRFYRQYFFSRALITSDLQKANPEIRLFLQQMAQRFTIRRKIRIGLSNLVTTPLTLGFWKPVILLPIAAINQLSIQQTEAVILHELNHIKQNDYLINLLIAFLDILLFFNPFSRLLTSILMKERENSCDDMVLQFRYSPAEYAKALLVLEQYRLQSVPHLAISATGNNKKVLLNRVQRILHGKPNTSTLNHKMVAFLFSSLLIGCTGLFNPGRIIVRQFPPLPYSNLVSNSPEVLPVYSIEQSHLPGPVSSNDFPLKEVSVILKPGKQTNWKPNQVKEGIKKIVELAILKNAVDAAKINTTEFNALPDFVAAQPEREFSIQDNIALAPIAEAFSEPQPYVPANSFSYQYIEDTTFPKRYVPTINELKAKENLELALKALEEIDWKTLQKELAVNNKSIDITHLQVELKKALKEVDWKKVEEEIKYGVGQPEQELKIKQAYLLQLQRFQKERIQQKQTEDQKRQLILMERVMQNKALQKPEEGSKKEENNKIKKIVVI